MLTTADLLGGNLGGSDSDSDSDSSFGPNKMQEQPHEQAVPMDVGDDPENDLDEDSSFADSDSSDSGPAAGANGSVQPNGRVIGRVHVGALFQATVPQFGHAHHHTQGPGEMLWDPARARGVEGLNAWIDQVCDEARASLIEKGRIKEHCLKLLHKWDYDLAGLKENWRRVCAISPLPATGSAHWSQQDSYLLEEVLANFPIQENSSKWKHTAKNALTNHTEGEIMERMQWLECPPERPILSYVPQPFQERVKVEEPARVVRIVGRPTAPPLPPPAHAHPPSLQAAHPQSHPHPPTASTPTPPADSASASEPKKRKIHNDLRRIQEHNHSLSNSPSPSSVADVRAGSDEPLPEDWHADGAVVVVQPTQEQVVIVKVKSASVCLVQDESGKVKEVASNSLVPHPPTPGKKVIILGGAFLGSLGLFSGIRSDGLANIQFSTFNASVPLSLLCLAK